MEKGIKTINDSIKFLLIFVAHMHIQTTHRNKDGWHVAISSLLQKWMGQSICIHSLLSCNQKEEPHYQIPTNLFASRAQLLIVIFFPPVKAPNWLEKQKSALELPKPSPGNIYLTCVFYMLTWGGGLRSDTAARHQGAIEIPCLHFWSSHVNHLHIQ